MRYRRLISLLVVLFLLIIEFPQGDAAPISSVSLDNEDVTVELAFPEEAHPTETITHNLTITAHSALTVDNFTLVIDALVNATWQQVHWEYISQSMSNGESIFRELLFTLPQKAEERLCCYIYTQTSGLLGSTTAIYEFYTTYVRTVTYDELLSSFTNLLADYNILLSEYDALLQSYSNLTIQYGALNSTFNSLYDEYVSLNSTYYNLQTDYNTLSDNYDSLENAYASLNQTYTDLQAEVTFLHQRENALSAELNIVRSVLYLFVALAISLAVLVIYIKKKKQEPYIVLRKETVALKPEQSKG